MAVLLQLLIQSHQPAKLIGRILVRECCFGNRNIQTSARCLPSIVRLTLQGLERCLGEPIAGLNVLLSFKLF